MTETERNQIKGALLKCAKENENKFTLTGHIVVSSLCKSAIERIEELEKENAELKEQCLILADGNVCNSTCSEIKKQLTKAKEIIKDFILMAKVEHLKDRYETVDEAEQFLNSEVEQ